jgi:membrane dipeptidase
MGFLDSTCIRKEDAFMEKHKIEDDSLIKSGMNGYAAEGYVYTKYYDEIQAFRPSLSILIKHIEYIINLVGVDFVGLGSDFDGIESAPLQLDNVSCYPLITKALVEKGYSEKDIDKILGGNLIRVLKANEVHSE